jgi:putative ABC transport system permease protein
MQPRYWKVTRDLTSDLAKSSIMAIAIAIGVFGIGAVMGARAVINREMTNNYRSTSPASATLEIESKNISTTLLDSVRKFPGIKEAERRATLLGRMKIHDRWYPILLFVIDDFDQMKISKFHPVSGGTHPRPGSMLVERTALPMMQAELGDSILIRSPNGTPRRIVISGVVHDPGLAPAWQEQAGYAYISYATLQLLGETQGFDLLRIAVNENEYSRDHITATATALSDWLAENGYNVHEIQVPPPGSHPHQGQMNAVLSIFTVFSFMILILGSILVSTGMATLMVKQVRQIGVMKTLGATSRHVAVLYLMMIAILCGAALLIAIPLSRITTAAFCRQVAVLLNLEISDSSIPYGVPLIQIASGIIIPLLAAAVPVIRGSQISVRKALDNHGVGAKSRRNQWAKYLSGMRVFGDTFNLSIRNVFRQQARLILTLALLAAGGAMFMMAMNVSGAWDKNLSRIYVQRLYDQEIRLNERIDVDSLVDQIKKIEGVSAVESWDFSSTSIVKSGSYEITRTYPDKGHGSFVMQALPLPTQLLNPTIVEGRWLKAGNSNEVVLNQLGRGDMNIGDSVTLSTEGKPSKWKIVGFAEDVGSPACAYVSLADFSKVVGASGKTKMLRIAYTDRSREYVRNKNFRVDELLEKEKISVSMTMPVWQLHNAVAAHMRVLVNSLLTMAILMAVVGSFGLMSAISMNVLERTREIGVMRAIGATPRHIRRLIVWEGLTIGVISIVVAFLLSLALSYFMGQFIGHISFRTPLTLTISSKGIILWIILILIGGYISSAFPARRVNSISTREALTYE